MTLKLTYRILAPIIILVAAFAFASAIAYAEETTAVEADASISADSDASTNTNTQTNTRTPQPKPKPLLQPIKNLLNADKRENVKGRMDDRKNAMEERKDVIEEKRENMQTSTTERMGERKDEMKERASNLREKGRENAISRIKMNIARYVRMLGAVIEREEKLISRIQSRADKLASEGKDVSAVITALVTATRELTAAKSDLARIKTTAEATASVTVEASATPATVFGNIRDIIQNAQKHIRAAHQAILDAVRALKAVGSVNASTEAEATP